MFIRNRQMSSYRAKFTCQFTVIHQNKIFRVVIKLLVSDQSFEAFLAVMFQVEIFCVVTSCIIVVGYQRFRGPCCLHFSMNLWNFGILPQHYTASQPRRWMQHGSLKRWYSTTTLHGFTNPEDGGSMNLWNVGILPQHCTASQPRRWRQHGHVKRWYPTTTLHGVTTQKTSAY
jgi:hypothetical protein